MGDLQREEIRFSFLADDHANRYGYRLAEPLTLDAEAQSYRLLFAKFPFKKKELVVTRAVVLQSVNEDRLLPELLQELDTALAAG